MKILVVDDAPEILLTTCHFIEIFSGKKPISTDSGKKALEILSEESFYLLITDWEMPETNGEQVVEFARSLKNIKVIVYSASDIPNSCKKPHIEYFKKPHDLLKIKKFIQKF